MVQKNEIINKTEDVYDISVPIYENFMLDNGVVVHNSKDIADAVAGCIWNCSRSKNIINLTRLTKAMLNPYTLDNQQTSLKEDELRYINDYEFERLRNQYSTGIFKNL